MYLGMQSTWGDIGSLKGHGHAILVHFKNQKYVLTSMNAQK